MALNYVTLTVTEQDAGQDAGTGTVTITPTSAVTAAGVTVVSQVPVTRQLSAGSASVQLVATDNAGTSPAAGFWAYSILLPGWTAPVTYLVDFVNGATQRLDNLTPVIAKTTYGPAATGGVTSFNSRTGAVVPQSGDYTAAQVGALAAKAGSTSVPAADLSPQVVALTDAATITVNAAAGNHFWVTLGGNRTMAAPTNAADGQVISFELIQDATGSRTLTWTAGAGGYAFGSGTAPTLSTAAGATDQAAFRYSSRKGAWLYLGTTGGF